MMSAPSSKGRWRYGVRNVLSTLNKTDFSLATLAMSQMSVIFNVAFEGFSTQIS